MSRGLQGRTRDLVLPLVFFSVAIAEVLLNALIEPKAAALVCETLMAAAIAARRSQPLLAVLVATGAGVAETALGVPLDQPIVPLFTVVLLAFSLVSHAPLGQAVAGSLLITAALAAQTVLDHQGFSNFVFGLVFVGAAWSMGVTVRRRTGQAAAARRAVEREIAERDVATRNAVIEERTRLARELHDVISHSVSAMVVQAGAAERVLDRSPEKAKQAVHAVGEIGRDALVELGRLLGVLREFGDEVGLEPQPGLGDLEPLLAHHRELGLDAVLEITGERVPLPVGVELTVFRLVQEALTNVRKHAAGVSPTIRLTFAEHEIGVEVTNPPPTSASRLRLPGAGHGLVGMRERVAVYGGSLESGPTPGGGFLVSARIPA